MNGPVWLPQMVSVSGEPDKVLAMLYGIFQRDFHHTARRLFIHLVSWDRRVVDPPYEEGFWHLITRKEHSTGDRLVDFRRAERLPWCGPVISNCTDHCVKVWDYEEGNRRVRTYLWLEAHDYVAILEKKEGRNGILAYLVTAFHIDGRQKRHDLERKYQKRVG